MKRTRAMSPPVEVQYRTIEDGDNRASLARPDITAIAMTLATGMAARTADAGQLTTRTERMRAGGQRRKAKANVGRTSGEAGGVSEESRRIMLSD